nr:hypothetical protein CFP56_50901 [Quercus suber]
MIPGPPMKILYRHTPAVDTDCHPKRKGRVCQDAIRTEVHPWAVSGNSFEIFQRSPPVYRKSSRRVLGNFYIVRQIETFGFAVSSYQDKPGARKEFYHRLDLPVIFRNLETSFVSLLNCYCETFGCLRSEVLWTCPRPQLLTLSSPTSCLEDRDGQRQK